MNDTTSTATTKTDRPALTPAFNRRWVLADRPIGREVRESDFALDTQPIPELRDGEFLVRTLYLSVAPVMRQYMLQGGAGERPLQFGEVMRGRGGSRPESSCKASWAGRSIRSAMAARIS